MRGTQDDEGIEMRGTQDDEGFECAVILRQQELSSKNLERDPSRPPGGFAGLRMTRVLKCAGLRMDGGFEMRGTQDDEGLKSEAKGWRPLVRTGTKRIAYG